ncbi:MAG TPA: gephyrin-like molybdotransferase Glp [Anaerolineaceae bacterium]
MTDLLPVSEAQSRIRAAFAPVSTTGVPLADALGRVLSVEIIAPLDLPPFTNSSMDGFAVRAADVAGASPSAPVTLALVAEIPAGAAPSAVIGPQQAARIMTGALLPAGADAVVPQEVTRSAPGVSAQVEILEPVRPGDYLRQQGSDLQAGVPVLRVGHTLTAQDLGLLAALGIHQVQVFRRPRIALLSSGDELTQPGQPLSPGKIYDSNTFMLAALVRESGAELLSLGVAADDPRQVRNLLQSAVDQGVDLILTSAGVSVGAFDYVRAVLEEQGRLAFWRVDMRPGKPLAFGAYAGIPVIGLPGNPVSAYVGFLIFARLAIHRLAGLPDQSLRHFTAVLDDALESDGRESYLRGTVHLVSGVYHARQAKNQSSANIFALVHANALLIVPSGVKSLPVGAEVKFMHIGTEG